MKKLSAIERYKRRRARRLDARGVRLDDEEGQWITTDKGHHVHLNEEGRPDKGNKHVMKAMQSNGLSGSKLPKVKKGSHYIKTVATCRNEMKKDGFLKEFNSTVKNLKPSDIVYQDNGKIASIPGLAAKIDNKVQFKDRPAKSEEVQKMYDDIRSREQKITSDVIDMSKDLGCYMSGLEFSMKSGSHFAEKIDRKKADIINERRKNGEDNPEISDEEVAAKIGDCVRYTMMTDNGKMVDNAKKVIDEFKKRGYKIRKVENKFFPDKEGDNVNYKGIHIDAISPDGQNFEFQIHSNETMKLKEANHPLYSKWKEKDGVKRTQAEKDQIDKQMQDNAKAVADPKGIWSFYPPAWAKRKK